MNWRQTIHQYLASCAEDDRDRLIANRLTSHRQRFLEQFGTQRLQQSENERIQVNAARTQKPPVSPDTYIVIEKGAGFRIIEVESGDNGHPYKPTRFLLKQERGQWKLDDYFWQCSCSDGKCNWCDGLGICSVCGGEGECTFCKGRHICQLCKGKRICSVCKGSDMPGWMSMTYKADPR